MARKKKTQPNPSLLGDWTPSKATIRSRSQVDDTPAQPTPEMTQTTQKEENMNTQNTTATNQMDNNAQQQPTQPTTNQQPEHPQPKPTFNMDSEQAKPFFQRHKRKFKIAGYTIAGMAVVGGAAYLYHRYGRGTATHVIEAAAEAVAE